MRLRSQEERRPKVVTWLGAVGAAVVAGRVVEEVVRRHDAKVIADHDRARKLAKKSRKKAKKAKKKVAKAKLPLRAALVGDGRGGH